MAVSSTGGRPPSSGRSPLSSEAKARPPSRAAQNSGLMPNWSPTLDLYIMLKTFGAVARRQGAY